MPTFTFLSTFKVKYDSTFNKMHNEVEFFVFRRMHRYGMYEFIRAMGIYIVEEMDHGDFDELDVHLPTSTTFL